jgi:predicted DsbA family dithiol-disulfide isomerase
MKVEIWSDITCTHCYIAKRKFETALSQFKHKDKLEISWRSFELAPGFKTDPNKFLPQFLQELYGTSPEHVQGMIDQVANSANDAGLEYNLNKAIPANSFNAHRLSHFAKDHRMEEKMKERLFKAYFTEGKNIDDITTLTELANEIGLNATEVKTILEGTKYVYEVNYDLTEAKQTGVTSVPKYVFNGNNMVSGAQDSNTYLKILEEEFARWQTSTEAQSCEVGKTCI